MRRPPRVVLKLPHAFTGPILLSADFRGEDPRRGTYEFPIPTDPFEPVSTLEIDRWLFDLNEVEADRDGVAITPAPESPAAGATHIWVPRPASMFYEDDYVEILFVGTKEQFVAFEQALKLRLGGQGPAKRLDRVTLFALCTFDAK